MSWTDSLLASGPVGPTGVIIDPPPSCESKRLVEKTMSPVGNPVKEEELLSFMSEPSHTLC